MKPPAKPVINGKVFVIIVKLDKWGEVFKNLVFRPGPAGFVLNVETEVLGKFVGRKFFGGGFNFSKREGGGEVKVGINIDVAFNLEMFEVFHELIEGGFD